MGKENVGQFAPNGYVDGPPDLRQNQYEDMDNNDNEAGPLDLTLIKMYHRQTQQQVWLPSLLKVWNNIEKDVDAFSAEERQLNNYSLLDVPAVAIQYRDLISLPYFLEEVSREKPAQAPLETLHLSEGMTLRGIVPLSAWVKSYEQRPMVTFFLDGKMLKQFRAPGHYRFALDTQAYAPGTKTLTVEARDSRNKLAGKQTLKVKFIR